MLQVVPGELTIITGLSNSGKSEWLDALTVNLAQRHNWQIAICSLENTPVEHGRKLMEKYLGESIPVQDLQYSDIYHTCMCLLADAVVGVKLRQGPCFSTANVCQRCSQRLSCCAGMTNGHYGSYT